MTSLIYKLEEMGVNLDFNEEGVHVTTNGELQPVDIKTLPHPGFYRYAITNDGIIINS